MKTVLLHDIIFSSIDRPKLLSRVMPSTLSVHVPHFHVACSSYLVQIFSRQMLVQQLTALLSEVGLNIQEAHVYSTKDGFCLDVFVVDGWKTEVNLNVHICLLLWTFEAIISILYLKFDYMGPKLFKVMCRCKSVNTNLYF